MIKGWLDDGEHPQTEALRVNERFRRREYGHIGFKVTIDDAKAYTNHETVNGAGTFLRMKSD